MAAIDSSSRRAFVAATLGQLAAMPILGATLQPEVPTLFADVPPGATLWVWSSLPEICRWRCFWRQGRR
jgi:hypothetical protein